jgi:hypothetical protein
MRLPAKLMKGRGVIRRNTFVSDSAGSTSKFIRHWPFEAKPGSTLAALERSYLGAFEAVDATEDYIKTVQAAKKFTAEGIRDEIQKYVFGNPVPSLHRSRLLIRKARAEATERKSRLKLQPPDKSDLVGAVLRREIRDRLTAMDSSAQRALFVGFGDNVPANIVQAVLEMPQALSCVSRDQYERLNSRALTALHGEEGNDIAELEEGIEIAEAAVEAAREEIRGEVRTDQGAIISGPDFDRLTAPFEPKSGIPWLRRHDVNGQETICTVPVGPGAVGGSARVATPEEVEAGRFFGSYAEFCQANGLDMSAAA